MKHQQLCQVAPLGHPWGYACTYTSPFRHTLGRGCQCDKRKMSDKDNESVMRIYARTSVCVLGGCHPQPILCFYIYICSYTSCSWSSGRMLGQVASICRKSGNVVWLETRGTTQWSESGVIRNMLFSSGSTWKKQYLLRCILTEVIKI